MLILSTEDLLSCCHTCGFGCNGGWPLAAWHFFKRVGICTGGYYKSHMGCKPYTIMECEHHVNGTRPPCQGEGHTPKCKMTCTNDDYTVNYPRDKSFGDNVYTVKSHEEQIQMEINEKWTSFKLHLLSLKIFQHIKPVFTSIYMVLKWVDML